MKPRFEKIVSIKWSYVPFGLRESPSLMQNTGINGDFKYASRSSAPSSLSFVIRLRSGLLRGETVNP